MSISKLQILKLLSRSIYQFMPRSVSHPTRAIAGYEDALQLNSYFFDFLMKVSIFSPSACFIANGDSRFLLTQGQGHTGR